MNRPQHLSAKGAAFIARFEGFQSHVYNDPAGNATIGYGHLLHLGPATMQDRARWPHGISRDEALQLLRDDADHAAECILANVHPPFVFQHRFDAVCSLIFNIGCAYLEPTHTIGKALQGSARHGAGAAFLLYNRANGKVLPGLTARRKAERRLFLYGRYT